MRGNLHVQFLGGWARVTASGYPSKYVAAIGGTRPFRRMKNIVCKRLVLATKLTFKQPTSATYACRQAIAESATIYLI